MPAFPDTFLYSISWEDTDTDKKILEITPTDRVLTLTGGGDNVFHRLLDGASQVDCADINPAQYHLMELKCKVIEHTDHGTLWTLFGEGVCPTFDTVLDRLRPHLADSTYDFWCRKRDYFSTGLYFNGSMGKMVSFVNRIGLGHVFTKNIENQDKYWYRIVFWWIVHVFLRVICWVLWNRWCMWNLFGVCPKQRKLIPNLYRYTRESLVPVLTQTDIEHDNHYYYLVLNGRFSKDNCPDYLQEGPFKGLQENVHKIRNYNDSFVNVLGSHIYDKVILMDHLDWTDHDYVQTLCDTLRYHMRYSVESKALLRSAARVPWYIEVFRRNGFVATRVATRQPDRCMDRVNTYASCWVIRHSVVSKN